MKLFRFGAVGKEKPGISINDKLYDLSNHVHDFDELFFENNGIDKLGGVLKNNNEVFPELADGVRIGCPVAKPSKIVCIGLNYAKHAHESNASLPKEPVIFLKSTTAICGPGDDVIIPRGSVKTDWEVELAVVIGSRASYVDEQDAMKYVAGYCLHNDISEREYQLERGGTWDKGKGCDTFAPIGPWFVTKDEITDPHNLRLWLKVNGKLMQDSNTSDLIFNIPQLISYVSSYMTLLPGDIISTGTPAGVGLGQKPAPFYLKAGDVMQLGIDGLGESTQHCIEYKK